MFRGSMVALVTPMQANGEVDYQSLATLVDIHLKCQTNAIVVLGTTGEPPTLNDKEREGIVCHVISQVAGRVPVIVGTGTNCTEKTIELTKKAMKAGADACLIVTPYYNKPVQEGLYQHYRHIADAVPIPQILYNVPGRTGCDLLPETVGRLASISNIVGVKEGNPRYAEEIVKRWGSMVDVYSADDGTALEIMRLGGKGVVSVAANIVPKAMYNLCKAALSSDFELANNLNERLGLLYKNLFVESNPIPVKWALHELGLIPPGIRLPLTPLAVSNQQVVLEAMRAAGL